MTAPAVGGQADDVKRDQADQRSNFDGDNGDFSTRAIDLELGLFALHSLEEYGIGLAFEAIGNVIFGAIVCKDLVSDTFAISHEAVGEAGDNEKQGDSTGRERKRDLQDTSRFKRLADERGLNGLRRTWCQPAKQSEKCKDSLALEAFGEVIDGPDWAAALREHDLRVAECERLG